MTINVEYTNQFEDWWLTLNKKDQDKTEVVVKLLAKRGTSLGYPYSSKVLDSKHPKMRELRIQSQGKPIRVFYCFDPKRDAILLIGGDKTGNKRLYPRMIPIADKLYDIYLKEIEQEKLI